ncbi:uncharacterized protein LOC129971048 [Argiope bruennichi]|uniref:uncharacterized protein LOC129971048 n=1 Tax=Argiope bruennichi TaxID=94029 RepID=UPI002495215A|nr:uncharacterized protein LOC129971048 [Argiope bruennichi]
MNTMIIFLFVIAATFYLAESLPQGMPDIPKIPEAPTMDKVPGADQMDPENVPGKDKLSEVPGMDKATEEKDKAEDMTNLESIKNISQNPDMVKDMPQMPFS